MAFVSGAYRREDEFRQPTRLAQKLKPKGRHRRHAQKETAFNPDSFYTRHGSLEDAAKSAAEHAKRIGEKAD